jgi:hypothetical protein
MSISTVLLSNHSAIPVIHEFVPPTFCVWWTLYKNMVNCLEHEVCCYNSKFCDYVIMIFNLDNVVGVRTGQRRNCGSISGRAYNFFFQIVDIGCGAHAMGTGGSNPTSSRHRPPYSVEVKNEWSCTSGAPIYLRRVHRGFLCSYSFWVTQLGKISTCFERTSCHFRLLQCMYAY